MSKCTFFILNGDKYYTEHDLTILELTTYFNYHKSLFVLEYNDLIYSKKSWDKILIKNKDKIEIITIVGGG